MISFSDFQSGPFTVVQRLTPPSIYLDSWALSDFSRNSTNRFTEALKRRGGTFVLSWANLLELAEIEGKHIDRLASFLDGTWPNLFIMDSNPGSVIEGENDYLQGQRVAPHAANELLKQFILLKKDSLNIFSSREFVQVFQSERIKELRENFMVEIQPVLERARIKAKSDPNVRTHQRIASTKIPMSTRFVFEESMKFLLFKDGLRMTNNDWFDFYHMVVPLSYCNFLLLDSFWASIARDVQKNLPIFKDTTVESAKIFCPRELDQFWKEFDV